MLASRPSPELPIQAESEDGPAEVSFARSRAVPDSVAPLSREDDGALLQTGPGKPDWNWRAYSLSWSGPVGTDRNMRLVILSDWLVSALRIVAIVALGLFAALFAFDIASRRWQWRLPTGKSLAGATSAMLLASVLVAAAQASADPPSSQVLNELKERLLAAPSCAPRCAEIVEADVDVAEETMTIRLTVHAMEDVAVPMPGALEGWRRRPEP